MLKKLASQTAIYGISSILGRLINLLLTPFYTRMFAEGEYGQISDLYSWVTLLNVVLTFGMETTFFRFMRESSDEQIQKEVYDRAFSWVGALSLFFSLGFIIFQAPLASQLGYAGQGRLVMWLAIILWMDNLAALPLARLRHQEKARRFALINLLNVLLTFCFNILFIKYLQLGIEYVFISNLIASGVRLLMSLYGELPEKIILNITPFFKEMLVYGFFIMIAGLAGMMNENLDKILIPRLWKDGTLYHGVARSGKEMLGLYAAGYKLGFFISLVTQAFRYAAEPFFFRHSDQKDSPQTFARIFHYFLIACLVCFLGVSAFMHEIVAVKIMGYTFINEAYWESLEIVPIVLGAYVLSAAYIQLSIWFKITKQTHYALRFTGAGALITILINVLTIPTMGYIGSAWATLICYAVMSTLAFVVGQKHYPIPYKMGRILLYALLFVGGYVACHFLGHGSWIQIAQKIAVCMAILGGIYLIEQKNPPKWEMG